MVEFYLEHFTRNGENLLKRFSFFPGAARFRTFNMSCMISVNSSRILSIRLRKSREKEGEREREERQRGKPGCMAFPDSPIFPSRLITPEQEDISIFDS